ncbi:MAG: hypothetical protein KBC36_10970 [Spirochaetia bacterium]|nr:hypothetical protein [Spirochaetia bacterium]
MAFANALVDSGNEKLLKASDLMGIMSTAMLAVSGLRPGSHPTSLELATLVATAIGSVVVHIAYGAWQVRLGARLTKSGEEARRDLSPRSMFMPSLALALQCLAFATGAGSFLWRIALQR